MKTNIFLTSTFKRQFALPISAVGLFLWLAMPASVIAQPPALNFNFQVEKTTVANGLAYAHYRSDTVQGLPLSIHVLEADLEDVQLDIALAMDQIIGQETVRSMAERRGAMAGVNGGFSFSNDPWNIFHGDPRDFLVQNGQIVSEPLSRRASFGIENLPDDRQRPFFEQVAWQGEVCDTLDNCISLTGINRTRREADLILYQPTWNRSTLTDATGMELVVENEEVVERIAANGSAMIPMNGYVLSASGTFVDSLARLQSEKLTLRHELTSLLNADRKVPLQNTSYHTAGPILMLNGEALAHHTSERIPESFVTTRHPRTGVGISADERRLFLVVVDGRQPELSVGMSLPELTQFFQRLGAHHAYNLDGGGSTTMVVDGVVKNSPSDGKERRRCDALLLFAKNKQGR